VDRDLTWVLDDWRLTPSGAIADDFGNLYDASHFGRVGNTVTLNGRAPESVAVRPGERVRLRLINAANARIFGLDFGTLEPAVVAIDGQPVTPHAPEGDMLLLAPGMRIDVVLDMTGRPGERVAVEDRFYEGLEYRLLDLVHAGEPLRARVPDWPMDLPANPLAEPDIAAATRHEVVFGGGMMGGMGAATQGGMESAMDAMRSDRIWFVNGVAATGPVMAPFLTLDQGRSYVLAMNNDTTLHHPIHLHGHSFRVIARDGQPTPHHEWQDTVLTAPRERVEIAFVADNPGMWMIHCHILEHQAAGMMGVIRVA
jgi:FtsP/CotA-like multicopper oxidase with cupredoxin domain